MSTGLLRWALALLLLLSYACTDDDLHQGQRSDEPVTVIIWDPEQERPRILLAERATQEGPRLRHTRFSNVLLRMPMDQGELILHTDHAVIDQGTDDDVNITLYPPLLVTGVIEGHPLQGRAREVSLDLPAMDVVLEDVAWVHVGQLVTVDVLHFSDDWQQRRAQGLRGRPADGPFLASQAALPQRLTFPAFRRVTVGE